MFFFLISTALVFHPKVNFEGVRAIPFKFFILRRDKRIATSKPRANELYSYTQISEFSIAEAPFEE